MDTSTVSLLQIAGVEKPVKSQIPRLQRLALEVMLEQYSDFCKCCHGTKVEHDPEGVPLGPCREC